MGNAESPNDPSVVSKILVCLHVQIRSRFISSTLPCLELIHGQGKGDRKVGMAPSRQRRQKRILAR